MATTNDQKIEKMLMARRLLIRGLANQAVQLVSGVGEKYIRVLGTDLRNNYNRAFKQRERKLRNVLRQIENIISNKSAVADTTLFLSVYERLGGSSVSENVDTDVMTEAYRLYLQLRIEAHLPEKSKFTYSDVWVLARNLRSAEIVRTMCKQCRSNFYYAVSQTARDDCAFCNPPGRRPE